mmetsp:Transcript_28067/g.26929  ORF Transcript_28067/g.26929 Transcript_28067/m.26929 type:complete len:437 (-) Transcript_28067:100-1410(-)
MRKYGSILIPILRILEFLLYLSLIDSAIESINLSLERVKKKIDASLSLQKNDNQCKWNDIKSMISSFLEPNSALIDAFTVDGNPLSSPILVQTTCFHQGSLGNAISQYIEGRLCAHLSGVNYISSIHISKDEKQQNSTFFMGFPSIVRHSSPVSEDVAKMNIKKICPCPSMCHEWHYGLIHSHMDIVRTIFHAAINSYWESRNAAIAGTFSGEYLNLSKAESSTSYVGQNGTIYSLKKQKLPFRRNFNGNKVILHEKQNTIPLHDLPIIPDVAIHYRCGDNVVTHYGFTPFRVFARIIPLNSKHIYILSESSERNSKHNSVTRCAAIFDALHVYLMDHFPQSIVVILRGHDIFEDLVRLTYANITICSVSTFCLWPAVTNKNLAYFPVTKLIAKENTSFNYGPSFHWLKNDKDKAIRGVTAVQMSIKELIKKLHQD